MKRLDFYKLALSNLGLRSTVNLQLKKRSSASELKLTSRLLKFPIMARRGTSDMHVFHQIFVEREYRCLDGLDLEGLIIDLGANVGYSAAYFLSRFPRCSVIAVEPDPDNYRILVKNVAPYGERVTTLKAAVWPQKGKLAFDTLSLGRGREWGRRVELSQMGSVDAITIPELLNGNQEIALLKIDIEGAERELFSSNYESWISRTSNIVIELHGDEARTAFFAALPADRFSISICDELTVCLSRCVKGGYSNSAETRPPAN